MSDFFDDLFAVDSGGGPAGWGMEELTSISEPSDDLLPDAESGTHHPNLDGETLPPGAIDVDPDESLEAVIEASGESSGATDADLGESFDAMIDASYDLVEPLPVGPAEVGQWSPNALAQEVGHAGGAAQYWHDQGSSNACAVVSQGSIIEAITGHSFDQEAATRWLEQQGQYSPSSGTAMSDTTRLFDAYGLASETGPKTVVEIYDALAEGKHVMVGLDAHEVWYPKHDPVTGAPLEWHRPGGHAVWVTGIGFDEAEQDWKVVLNDSGHPDGRASVVALADFVNATDDYGNYTVVVDPASYTGAKPDFAEAK